MEPQSLLRKLGIKDEKTIFNFLLCYSRFEYALKRAGYCTQMENGIKVNWEQFLKEIREDFKPNQNPDLKDAVEYLLSKPTKAQVINDNGSLDFIEHPSTQEGPKDLRVFNSIRIARNNLFHGGKFPIGQKMDVGRDERLLQSSLIVLEEFLELDENVNHYFNEGT